MVTRLRWALITALLAGFVVLQSGKTTHAAVTKEDVERSIRDGVRFLKSKQRADGSWLGPDANDLDSRGSVGTTSLVTLALLTAGESADSPTIQKALGHLRNFGPKAIDHVYSISLQTMVFAAAKPKEDLIRIAANVSWLEDAQLKPGDPPWPGSWSYRSAGGGRVGDNSNSQYALLALNAAAEVNVPVKQETWTRARQYWKSQQHRDGSWAYHPTDGGDKSSGSMTCAGISSMIITGTKLFQGQEIVRENGVDRCGEGGSDPDLKRAIDWMAQHFKVGQNPSFGFGSQWKYYYLYGLERAGRLSGIRYFGSHDWYREGAEELIHDQDKLQGYWAGSSIENIPEVATSFALLFLAKGRAPVLVNKLRHGPGEDWTNDVDDVRNLVGLVSKDWGTLMTWQAIDPSSATLEEMLQAPIAFINGHQVPVFTPQGKRRLREFVEQGGFIFAEACCGRKEFDQGFRALMKEIFPEDEYELQPLREEHAVWRAKWPLSPDNHPLWGIEHGCRTVVIYSPDDLSCYWNQMENQPGLAKVLLSQRVGQNVIDYATGREIPADKLSTPEVKEFKNEIPKLGALRVGKLKHAGEWNIAPLAIPNLMTTLRDKVKFDVVIGQKELIPSDKNLVNFPLLYLHGRAGVSFGDEDKIALRKHLDTNGTLFADAACGSTAFDTSFRKFAAELSPNNPLVPIPRTDEIYTQKVYYDLKDCQYSKSAGGGKDFPQLEGVKINGHWALIYSKLDIGCALERHAGLDCKGYSFESAIRIASNIVIYSTLP
jgi:hypothetical protein